MFEHWSKHGFVHCTWAISCLLAIIVWLLVQKPDSAELQELFNFSAAVASLILAVVAIFYSFVSNQDQSHLLTTTRDAAERVEKSSNDLSAVSDEVRNLIGDLSTKIEEIPESVRTLQSNLSNRLDIFSLNHVKESDKSSGRSPVNIGSNLSLYIVARMHEAGKSVNTMEAKAHTDPIYCDILFGFLSCLSTFRPCDCIVDAVGSSFAVKSIGSLPVDDYLAADFSKTNEETIKVKAYFDSLLGVNSFPIVSGVSAHS